MRKKPWVHLLIAVLLFMVQFYLAVKVFNMKVLRAYEEVNSSEKVLLGDLLARSLGEVRFTLAAQLWILADIYMHKGEEKGLSPFEQNDLLYLMRIITFIDPHFVKAYDYGGYVLGRFASYKGHGQWDERLFDEAVKFLKEGIKNNPKAFKLYMDLGVLYLIVKKDYKTALSYLLPAEMYFKADPPGDKLDYGFWLNQIYSFIIKCYYELGDYDQAEKYVYYRMKVWPRSKRIGEIWLKRIAEARAGKKVSAEEIERTNIKELMHGHQHEHGNDSSGK